MRAPSCNKLPDPACLCSDFLTRTFRNNFILAPFINSNMAVAVPIVIKVMEVTELFQKLHLIRFESVPIADMNEGFCGGNAAEPMVGCPRLAIAIPLGETWQAVAYREIPAVLGYSDSDAPLWYKARKVKSILCFILAVTIQHNPLAASDRSHLLSTVDLGQNADAFLDRTFNVIPRNSCGRILASGRFSATLSS